MTAGRVLVLIQVVANALISRLCRYKIKIEFLLLMRYSCQMGNERDMLLGECFVLSVLMNIGGDHRAPRDADTANALCLKVCSVPAVCELPVSRCEREFVPSDCDIKINTIHEGWCSFLWRRKRDSNPRAFWANGFQGVIHCRILEENNRL